MKAPNDEEVWPIHPKEGWEGRWSIGPETWEKIKDTTEVKWELRKTGWTPYRIETADDIPTMPMATILEDVSQNRQAKAQLNQILGTNHGFDTPKPYDMIARLVSLIDDKNCLVMDSFCGSGSTSHAVLDLNKKDGGERRFITVEIDPHISREIAKERLRRVVVGFRAQSKLSEVVFQKKIGIRDLSNSAALLDEYNELRDEYKSEFDEVKGSMTDGILTIEGIRNTNEDIPGLGGGFRFCTLGTALFNEFGDIDPGVTFADLAAHIFFSETGAPVPKRPKARCALIGTHKEKAVYLLFSAAEQGIAREAAGNVLTPDVLAELPPVPSGFAGQRVVYGEGCTVSADRLKTEGVTFKQIPYQIEAN